MNSVIIDTNLLCLLIAGEVAPQSIGRHKRLKAFSIDDYRNLMDLLSNFDVSITCPNVLTEASNLLANTFENEQIALLNGLKAFSMRFGEKHTPSGIACEDQDYTRLGLTDAVLLTMMEHKATLLTVDLALCLAAQARGHKVINYNWVRDSG